MILGCFWKIKVILGLWVVNFKPGFEWGFKIIIANWGWIQNVVVVVAAELHRYLL